MGQEQPDFIHPANVEEVANVAREVGAEVLRGPLTYPSETGGRQLGDLDLSEYLHKYRGCEITLVIAATGEAEERPVVCGICGFAMDEVLDELQAYSPKSLPDCICILGQGTFRRHAYFSESDGSFHRLSNQEDSLLAFFLYLLDCVTFWQQVYRWGWYARDSARDSNVLEETT